MASKAQVESWTGKVTCPICLHRFTDPVSLPCQHNFCRSCITRFCERKERNSCPECREDFADRTLGINWALRKLSEKSRKRRLNSNEKESKLHCEEHDEELKLFCETDKTLICVICTVSREHKKHCFLPIKDAVENYKETVKSALQSLMRRQQIIEKMEQQQKQKMSGIWEQSHSLQSHITSQFAELHQILTEKEQQLLKDLREEEARILNPVEKNLQEIQKNLNSIREEISRLQEQMDQKDHVQFLKEESRRKRRTGHKFEPVFVSEGALSFENFDHPLLYTAWRALADGIKQVSVTLDVETAGPKLEVLPDLKSVRWTGYCRDLPDTGKRFTSRSYVLGSDGFTSGRHYWEVDAAECQRWGLGVAAESVERKGDIKLMTENGFWIIWRKCEGFYIPTSPPSRFPAGPSPGRVGVYLSYESGTVSFYNAETKSHLHTYSGNKFTEKLYPFFWTGDENWLRICPGSTPGLPEVRGVNMASKDQIVSLTEEAICPICLDFFIDPVSLECGHNFCRHCITQCWKNAQRNSCPECRAQFADHTLRSSWALASMADKVRRLSLSLKEKENKHHCKEHEEELKLFCETDQKLICVICATAREHKAHNLLPVEEAAEIYKVQIKSSLDSYMKYKAIIQEMEEEQTRKISEFWGLSHSIQSHIKSQFAKLHQILTEKEQRLLRDLMEEEERILNPMEKSLREIHENLSSIEEEIARLQKQMDQNDSVTFLKEEARRKTRVNKDTPVFSVVEGALRARTLSTVWRGIVDAVTQVSVALDVETAAVELSVSDYQKSASCAGTLRSLPDTGKGITNRPCELGREGFTSGRYYWEVEVAGNQGWCLGVTAESPERSADIKLIPKNGFWTIWQRDDEFYVFTSPPSRLPANTIPGRVGVYLSYESGTVSFYSAETNSHLHTFTGNKFTGRLYPFFWTWDGSQWLRMWSRK
ncbi:uncharacterized protein [Mobula birostris]|uniref:uncharacterized protein n=1 Tax=Mobula birostris TaxID=1983395 RepID=UPI003B2859F9